MGYKELLDEIKQKRQKVRELSISIEVYCMKPVSREVKAQEEVLKDRLTFRLAELELQGLKEKEKIMKELLSLLHKESQKISVLK